MYRSLPLLLALGFVLSAAPAEAQLGRLVNRARDAAERTANQATDRAAENAAGTAASAAVPGRAEVVEAARRLVDAYQAHIMAFREPITQGFDYDYVQSNWPDHGERWLAAAEAVEAHYPAMQEPMAVLAGHFGEEWLEIDNGMRRMGVSEDEYGDGTGASHAYRSLQEGMEAVLQFRRDVADGAVREARRRMEGLREHGDVTDVHIRVAEEIHAALALAQRFDPDSEGLNELLAEAEGFAGEMQEQMMAQIEAARWPGHAAGAPADLAPGILAYFRSHPNWGGQADTEVLAVAVRGGWAPAKHNLLGQVVQWRLPVVVASVRPAWREHGAARMFELSVLTQEANPPRQGPPYDGYWVGLASGFIALDRVPRP